MSSIDALRPILRAEMSKLKVPNAHDKVYKDECMYSFDSPFTATGLYVNMNTFHGFGQDYLKLDMNRTKCKIYLHEKWTQSVKEVVETVEVNEAPTKLAIGVEGGFSIGEAQYDIKKEHFLIIVDGDQLHSFALPNEDLPEFISNVANAIIGHEGMKTNLQVSSWDADNEKIVSKFASTLVQLNPEHKKIPQDSKLWVDEATGASDNLWLNLSTGYIGGGRQNWDGTGGSGSALAHFEATGSRYPLVVKLGTITPHGADVWSYAPEEDCLVVDPLLAEHLSFWGIDVMRLEKTAKTLGEMEVSLNMSYDWTKILDGGEALEVLHGAGLVGLRNIGSSCYLNSAVQCLLSVPEIQERYLATHDTIVSTSPADPSADFLAQFSKLAVAVLTDRYVPTAEDLQNVPQTASGSLEEAVNSEYGLEKYVIAPRMFKHLVAKGNAEFSSGRQQDVSEYFMHFLEVMAKAERTNLNRLTTGEGQKPTNSLFEFHLETRYQCVETGEVRYTKSGQQTLATVLDLLIPVEKGVHDQAATTIEGEEAEENKKKQARLEITGTVNEPADAKLLVPFTACLETFAQPDTVDIYHPSLGRNAVCTKSTRFKTFPRYLMVKMARYYAGPNWVQMKINARVDVPEQLDLTHLRGQGLQEGEKEIPEGAATTQSAAAPTAPVTADEGIVMQLVSMGFSENGSRRAAIATGNVDAEVAMDWVVSHMEDADFNEPIQETAPSVAGGDGGGSVAPVDPEMVAMLQSFGYSAEQTTAALMATDNNVERAADWLFSHADNLDESVAEVYGRSAATATGGVSGAAGDSSALGDDGEGKYTLMAVISHIGRNTDHGHYVCHIRKNGQWVLFNDEKVGKCKSPPLEYGFMYLYRRNDGSGTLKTN